MFDVFREEKVIATLMFVCLGLSILLRMILGMLYQGMIRETDNMATTENVFLRQCKTKFTNCYQLSNGVANIPVFVDKFLNRLCIGRISFESLYHMSGQVMLLSVVCSGLGICKSIVVGRTIGELLPFYIVSFFGLYLYFSVSTVVDIKGKRRILKINLVDYLENHLSPRIGVTKRDIELLYGENMCDDSRDKVSPMPIGRESRSRRMQDDDRIYPEEKRVIELMPIGNRKAAGSEAANIVSAQELEDLLQEFLTT